MAGCRPIHHRSHTAQNINAGTIAATRRAAAIYTLVETAKLNDIDPQVWLADVLARLADYSARRISDLLPWNWNWNYGDTLLISSIPISSCPLGQQCAASGRVCAVATDDSKNTRCRRFPRWVT